MTTPLRSNGPTSHTNFGVTLLKAERLAPTRDILHAAQSAAQYRLAEKTGLKAPGTNTHADETVLCTLSRFAAHCHPDTLPRSFLLQGHHAGSSQQQNRSSLATCYHQTHTSRHIATKCSCCVASCSLCLLRVTAATGQRMSQICLSSLILPPAASATRGLRRPGHATVLQRSTAGVSWLHPADNGTQGYIATSAHARPSAHSAP